MGIAKLNAKRWLSLFLVAVILVTGLPITGLTAAANTVTGSASIVTDPGTAADWETMMGTDADGNRYAGRVWADKSVYKDADTVMLNSRGEAGSSFVVDLEADEAFQVVFSVLGSSMTTTATKSSTGPMDVVLVMDSSVSMNSQSGTKTRLQHMVEAANALLEDLTELEDVRIGIVSYNQDADTILALDRYTNGLTLGVNAYRENYNGGKGGKITAYDKDNRALGSDNGYNNGTNLQSGIEMGMKLLANASNVQGRNPVVILLTDGEANHAVYRNWYSPNSNDVTNSSYNTTKGIILSTIMNAAYNRALIEDHYGRAPVVYGIGVELDSGSSAHAIMNPAASFNSSSRSQTVRDAYTDYTTWKSGSTVEYSAGWVDWVFDHNLPSANSVTSNDVISNINYVDAYYPVSSSALEGTFEQIYEELTSGAFNPISSTTTTQGGTGVENTPLIYVDHIGQHMEIKQIQSVTLFGSSYDVIHNSDGTYTVAAGTGVNPTTNENWNTAEDIRISITRNADGTQKLEIRINQEILPILLEQVISQTVGNVTSATITEIMQDPLRVYYTVGVAEEVLLANGKIDITKITGANVNANGEITLYSNVFGKENTDTGSNTLVDLGDAHIGFKPSVANRYYYHQVSQSVFTAVKRKDNTNISWDASEYGVRYEKDTFDLTYLTPADLATLDDTDTVYTYVTYYHPTPSTTDAANAAEEVTYLVYNQWQYLKESIGFYDLQNKVYINYDAANIYSTGTVGYAVAEDKMAAVLAAYSAAVDNENIIAILGVGSHRTSRLHNMYHTKSTNATASAELYYAPQYTYGTVKNTHNDNDVIIWLGNNGKLTAKLDTGIELSKAVTEPIGSANDTYALTVTVPAGVTAAPAVWDTEGNNVTATVSTYRNNVLTVNLKAGEKVYIDGIPAGTVCTIGETIPATGDYTATFSAATVTVPVIADVLAGTVNQYASVTVTNAPNKYGNLTIIKDILHDLPAAPDTMEAKEFTFTVQLPVALANKVYRVDKSNASLFAGTDVTVGADGSFTVVLKNSESITVLGLPEGTNYTVTESAVAGYTNTSGVISGTIGANGDHDAHFVNAYSTTPFKPQVTITGTKTLEDINGTYTANEDFVFELYQYFSGTDGNPGEYRKLASATAKKGQSYTFALDELLTTELGLGEHHFMVVEKAGSTAGMVYDSSRGLFVVKVTDSNADGALEYQVMGENATTTVSGTTVTKNFTNIYDVTRTHVDINIQKTLVNETGVDMPLELFSFVLTNAQDFDERYTVTADAAGKAVIRIPELGPGSYKYILLEVGGSIPGMSYSEKVYTVNITVTENGGVLTAVAEFEGATAVNGDNTLDAVFENTYALESVKHTITGNKQLIGRDIKDGEFRFELYEANSGFEIGSTPKETVANVGAGFAFTQIEYKKVGTYYYSVKEVKGTAPGMTYDTTHYHVTVKVEIDSADQTKLKVTQVQINKVGNNSDTSGNIVFVNSYATTPTAYTISGTKSLSGRAMRAHEFTFALYAVIGTTETLIDTTTNNAEGAFTFKEIPYDKTGTYTYVIREVAGTAPGVAYTGVNTPVTVKVTVTDTNSVLSAVADVANANIAFTNTYTATDAVVTFAGTKTLVGGNLKDGDFTFELYKTDISFDIKNGTLLASAANNAGAFGFAQRFDTTDTYFFALVEKTGTDEGIVYDRTQHNFVVRIEDEGDGKLRARVHSVELAKQIGFGTAVNVTASFVNAVEEEAAEKEVYLKNSLTTHIDGKKVNVGDVLTYRITYTNYTGEDVMVDILDTIPAHTSYVDGSASHGGTYVGTNVNWVLSVPRGESITVSFDVKVNDSDAVITNTAVIRDGKNVYTTNTVSNHTIEADVEKDVFAAEDQTVSIDGKKVYAGDKLTYVISYTNASSAPVNATITDKIPAGTAYVANSADKGGVHSDGMITWDLRDIPAWTTVQVSFSVTVNANIGAATIANEAIVAQGTNQYTTNKVTNYTVQDAVEKNVFQASDPTVSVDGKKVAPGTVLVYTISYKNTDRNAATVTITDTVPANTVYLSDSADHNGVWNDGTVTWTVTVPAGETVTVSFKVKVADVEGTTITNEAVLREGKNTYTTNQVTAAVEKPVTPPPTEPTEPPTEPTEPPTEPTTPPTEIPPTGDTSLLGLCAVLLVVCGVGLICLMFGDKKRNRAVR